MSLINKILCYLMVCVVSYGATEFYITNTNRNLMEVSLNQLRDGNTLDVQQLMWANNTFYMFATFGVMLFGLLLFKSNINDILLKDTKP